MKSIMPLVLAGFMWLVIPAHAQTCPAVGNDTDCGTIITVTDKGATVSFTGQGPFDGIEDTLVGVINKSKLPIGALGLTSSQTIFGFDGDGLTTFGVPGNPRDSTGYGGPNAFFTNINSSQTSGTVNFIVPIPPGGTGFFGLEESLSSATACSTVLNKALTKPGGGGTQITASFTPNLGFTLAQAAQLCGFIKFDWQQTITFVPKPSPVCAAGSSVPLIAPPKFNDPPPQGYSYQNPPNAVELPVYYNLFTTKPDPLSLDFNETDTTLSFFDSPTDPCLTDARGKPSLAWQANLKLPKPQTCGNSKPPITTIRQLCGNRTAPAGSKLAFTTHLVGIAGLLPGADVIDTGIGFTWTDNFNGTSGGIAVTNSSQPVDPGSGVGTINVTSVNDITTLSDIAVTTVNGTAPGTPPTLTAGNACDGIFSGAFVGDIVVVAGQDCTFIDGTITGRVRQRGGNLVLTGTSVSGGVHIHNNSTFTIGPFVEINGNLEIDAEQDMDDQDHDDALGAQTVAAGTVQNQICDTTVDRDLSIQNSALPVQVGSTTDASCPGNVLGGNIQMEHNNTAIALGGNTVTGSVQLDHNAAVAVFNNIVLEDLKCEENASITGGGNQAKRKQGQCSIF